MYSTKKPGYGLLFRKPITHLLAFRRSMVDMERFSGLDPVKVRGLIRTVVYY